MTEFGEVGLLDRLKRKPYIETIVPERYQLRIARGQEDVLPLGFYKDPLEFLNQNGQIIKSGPNADGRYGLTEVRRIPLPNGSRAISKRFLPDKMGNGRDTNEFDILTRAWQAGLPGALPIASVVGFEIADGSYTIMSEVLGRSGRFIDKRLYDYGKTTKEIEQILQKVFTLYAQVVEEYQRAGIDKPEWHTKDLILDMSRSKGEVYSVTPIDFERAKPYDPKKPGKVVVDRTIAFS